MEALIGAAQAPADTIKDSDQTRFAADVIEASKNQPVLVDFWAPWCGPCKQLTPALEKVVKAAGGKVKLVKINVDENKELAQQLRIQSIPVVYGFRDGRPVDGFVGAQSESQIRAFVERLLGAGAHVDEDPIDAALSEAKAALEAHDAGTATAIYGQVLAHDPKNAKAIAGLARARAIAGDPAQARKYLDAVPKEAANDPDVAAARSAVELAEKGKAASGKSAELEARIAKDPADHQARFDLAMAKYATQDTEAAIEGLLEIIRRKRDWNEEAARKQLVQIFEALGSGHPLVTAGRRRLSSILFA
jgi:putative thioredoxin